MKTELKPCPFCGAKLKQENRPNPDARKNCGDLPFITYYVHPNNECFLRLNAYRSGGEVLKQWNRRADDSNNRLYAVRDKDTGKLVSNITNPRRKYWDRKGNALAAIQNSRYHGIHKDLKLVVFELVEIEENGKE